MLLRTENDDDIKALSKGHLNYFYEDSKIFKLHHEAETSFDTTCHDLEYEQALSEHLDFMQDQGIKIIKLVSTRALQVKVVHVNISTFRGSMNFTTLRGSNYLNTSLLQLLLLLLLLLVLLLLLPQCLNAVYMFLNH